MCSKINDDINCTGLGSQESSNHYGTYSWSNKNCSYTYIWLWPNQEPQLLLNSWTLIVSALSLCFDSSNCCLRLWFSAFNSLISSLCLFWVSAMIRQATVLCISLAFMGGGGITTQSLTIFWSTADFIKILEVSDFSIGFYCGGQKIPSTVQTYEEITHFQNFL